MDSPLCGVGRIMGLLSTKVLPLLESVWRLAASSARGTLGSAPRRDATAESSSDEVRRTDSETYSTATIFVTFVTCMMRRGCV
jgi:hypothetical protein